MSNILGEVRFELDNFQQAKVLDSTQSLVQIVLNILLMRPGNMPGFPNIGIDIKQYMYRHSDAIDPEEIKQKIYSQCNDLYPELVGENIAVFLAEHKNEDILVIAIPITVSEQTILYGFQKSPTGDLNISQGVEQTKNIFTN